MAEAEASRGMTLRDYFAAKFISRTCISNTLPRDQEDAMKIAAKQAYAMADAMLAHRTKS